MTIWPNAYLDEIEAAKSRQGEVRKIPERGWLIERGDSQPCSPDYYGWCDAVESDDGPGLSWTKDHHNALRFARKIDAQRFADDIGWNNVRICEHEWSDPAPPLSKFPGKE